MAAQRSEKDLRMDLLDCIGVRFHFRGSFEWNKKDWIWSGGRHGMSTIALSKLSVAELKKHLADHIVVSDEVMERTELCWKMPAGPTSCAIVNLVDKRSVLTMAKYVSDAGVIDIFAKIPADLAHVDSGEEEVGMHIENAPLEYDFATDEAQVEENAAAYAEGQYQQAKAHKLPVHRPTKQQKGKEKAVQVEDFEVLDDSNDSDYDEAHEADDSNSSAEDEEAVMYRQVAKEVKKKVRERMLGEEEMNFCKIPDEFLGYEQVKTEHEEEEEAIYDTDDELSYDEDSEDENAVKTRRTKHRVYDETAEVQDFHVGQAFSDSRQFKQALLNYGLKNFHHLKFTKDEHSRVRAHCSWKNCKWSIYGSITSKSRWLLVSRYNNVHTCVPRRDNKLVTSTVIAEKYFREIKDNPGWRVEKMQEAVLYDLCADVSASKCKRAKKLVIERIIDQTSGEYSRVYDYHLELERSNPGSTISVTLNPDITDRPVFERMYICLDGCKKGFAAGCRRIVGLDGCFLKGPVKGQLLCAVGRDPNNQMYPIAWACVENENYDSWYWFLSLLQKDLQINNHGESWVIISDQQKGLIKAVSEIIPEAEHRMCARHIYANWKKIYRDKIYQKMFWACAKSSDQRQFNYNRAKLAQKTGEGAIAMMKTAPMHWCRAFFKLGSFCDSVENNLCESFNNAIMRARFYPVISQMEIIRRKVTARIAENKAKSRNWTGTICPNVFKKLKLNIKRSNICTVLYNGEKGFEVEEGRHRRFTVCLEKNTCSCRYWDLSGLPCPHAISAIYSLGNNIEDYIAPCYRIDVYDQIYSNVLQPVEGKESWPIAPNPRPCPPMKINMPGRPKTERRREEGEAPKGTQDKLSKKGVIIRCSLCGGENHNKRKCTATNAAQKEHAQVNKAAKRKSKKDEQAAGMRADGQQPNVQQPTSHVQQHTRVQEDTVQPTVHVPPKKKPKKKSAPGEGSSSQPTPVHTASSQRTSQQFRTSETIPMSQVVTEPVPQTGRLQWYLWGNNAQSRQAGQDGDGAE